MSRTNRCFLATLAACVALAGTVNAVPIVNSTLNASLDTGSLAGVKFPVSFSYDAGLVQPVGDSYVNLLSFDFVLLGVPFNRSEIFQGGQAMFHDGILENVTASYQVTLPPMSPVANITFGFGGPGVIGYVDLKGQFGLGSFSFGPPVPEPSTLVSVALSLAVLICGRRWMAGKREA